MYGKWLILMTFEVTKVQNNSSVDINAANVDKDNVTQTLVLL